jgi:hypothetical protein
MHAQTDRPPLRHLLAAPHRLPLGLPPLPEGPIPVTAADPFRCICPLDADDLVNGYPRAVEGCPAHRARYAAQQLSRRADHQARLASGETT